LLIGEKQEVGGVGGVKEWEKKKGGHRDTKRRGDNSARPGPYQFLKTPREKEKEARRSGKKTRPGLLDIPKK